MSSHEEDVEEALEPTLLDMDDNPVWIHGCETMLAGEDDDEDGTPAIHVVVSAYRGRCDLGEDHFTEVSHFYSAAMARQLAAALLNASDMLDEYVAGE